MAVVLAEVPGDATEVEVEFPEGAGPYPEYEVQRVISRFPIPFFFTCPAQAEETAPRRVYVPSYYDQEMPQ